MPRRNRNASPRGGHNGRAAKHDRLNRQKPRNRKRAAKWQHIQRQTGHQP